MVMEVKKKRTRRSVKEGEAFRAQLIETARQMFIEQGYDAVSIRKITEQAGCPPMTFYVYFRNKRELIRHIWDDLIWAAVHRAEAAAADHQNPEAALEAFALAWLQYWLDNPDNFRVSFLNKDILAGPDDIYYTESSRLRERFTIIGHLVERGVAQGVFTETNPEVVTQMLLSLTIGLAHCLVDIPEYRWDPSLPKESIRTILRGLRRELVPKNVTA